MHYLLHALYRYGVNFVKNVFFSNNLLTNIWQILCGYEEKHFKSMLTYVAYSADWQMHQKYFLNVHRVPEKMDSVFAGLAFSQAKNWV